MNEEKTFTIELTEPEINVLWNALNTATVVGNQAPLLVSVMGKVQQAVSPSSPAPADEPPAPVDEEPAPETAEAPAEQEKAA